MREIEVADVINVKSDSRELPLEERIKREKALGSVIMKYFEDRNMSLDAELNVNYLAGAFTRSKVIAALEYASSIAKTKGYVLVMTLIQYDENKFGFRIRLGKVEDTDEFKKAVQRAIERA